MSLDMSQSETACGLCGGGRWLLVDGVVTRCRCAEADDAERRARRLAEVSSFGPAMERLTFEAFRASREWVAYRGLRDWAERPSGWRYLGGPPGRGKTHLLAATYQVLRAAGHSALYVVVPDLLDYLRDGIRGEGLTKRARLVRDVGVLLLDDLGAEAETAWEGAEIYALLDHRYRHERPTAVATNLLPDDLPPRLRSRLLDERLCARYWFVHSDDYRQSGTQADRVTRDVPDTR